jgi:hypothetical protein
MRRAFANSQPAFFGRVGPFRRHHRRQQPAYINVHIRIQHCLLSTQQHPVQIEKHHSSSSTKHQRQGGIRRSLIPQDGLTLEDFVHQTPPQTESKRDNITSTISTHKTTQQSPRTFHIKTYGCQMNVNDSDIVRAILLQHGYQEWQGQDEVVVKKKNRNKQNDDNNVIPTSSSSSIPDIILTNTCAIREKAEDKVWQRLRHLRKQMQQHQIVGVLGCMAERLQSQLLQENMANIVVGPDQYRQLPQLLDDIVSQQQQQQQHPKTLLRRHRPIAMNVELSLEETYDDIVPIRDEASNPFSAFVSIQRGCSNRWYVLMLSLVLRCVRHS